MDERNRREAHCNRDEVQSLADRFALLPAVEKGNGRSLTYPGQRKRSRWPIGRRLTLRHPAAVGGRPAAISGSLLPPVRWRPAGGTQRRCAPRSRMERARNASALRSVPSLLAMTTTSTTTALRTTVARWVAPLSRVDLVRHVAALRSVLTLRAMTTASMMTTSRTTVARWDAPLARMDRVRHVAASRSVSALPPMTTAATITATRTMVARRVAPVSRLDRVRHAAALRSVLALLAITTAPTMTASKQRLRDGLPHRCAWIV